MTKGGEFDPTHALSAMRTPGTTLVFVDDTDFHGGAVDRLLPDLRILAAVKLDSGYYADIEAVIFGRLRDLGQDEFHAADVFNPKMATSWRNVTIADRIAMFELMSSLIDRSGASMRYIFISNEQYRQMRRDHSEQGNADLGVSRNAALKRVMLRSLRLELSDECQRAMIMIDQVNRAGFAGG